MKKSIQTNKKTLVLTELDAKKSDLNQAIIAFFVVAIGVMIYSQMGTHYRELVFILAPIITGLSLDYSLTSYYLAKKRPEEYDLRINEEGIAFSNQAYIPWREMRRIYLSGGRKNNDRGIHLIVENNNGIITSLSLSCFYGRFNPYHLKALLLHYIDNEDKIIIKVWLWIHFLPSIIK